MDLSGSFSTEGLVEFTVSTVSKEDYMISVKNTSDCGLSSGLSENRKRRSIKEGHQSELGNFVVTIVVQEHGNVQSIFSGTLISKRLVLTAAHVFRGLDFKSRVPY